MGVLLRTKGNAEVAMPRVVTFETRPVSNVTTLGFATLGLLFVGLALNIVCLILLLRNYKRSPIFGIVGSVLYFPAAIADQTGLFSSLSPDRKCTRLNSLQRCISFA